MQLPVKVDVHAQFSSFSAIVKLDRSFIIFADHAHLVTYCCCAHTAFLEIAHNNLFSMVSKFDTAKHNHIRRSKSTTSITERRQRPIISEPFKPENGRLHALIAAHRAMDRSRGSASDELCRSDSSVSRKSAQQRPLQGTNMSLASTQLQRQKTPRQAE